MLFNSVFTIFLDFNIQCRVCYTACSVNRRETVSLFKFPIKSLMIPFELNWPVSLITIYILYVIITKPNPPSWKKKAVMFTIVMTSNYQSQLNTGFSKECEIFKVCSSLKYIYTCIHIYKVWLRETTASLVTTTSISGLHQFSQKGWFCNL